MQVVEGCEMGLVEVVVVVGGVTLRILGNTSASVPVFIYETCCVLSVCLCVSVSGWTASKFKALRSRRGWKVCECGPAWLELFRWRKKKKTL